MEASANDHKVEVQHFPFTAQTLVTFALMARNSLKCVSKRSLYSLNSGVNIWYSPWSRRRVDTTNLIPSFSIAVFRDMSQQQHFFVWLMHLYHKQQYPHTALVDCTLTRGKWLWTAASSAARCGIAGLWFVLGDTTMTDVALKFCTACWFPRPRVKDRIQNDESWNYTEYNVNAMVLPGVPVIAWGVY